MNEANAAVTASSASRSPRAARRITSTLGITFLRGFVTVIDVGNSRVGFAPDTGCATNGSLRVVHPRAWPPTSRPPRLHQR